MKVKRKLERLRCCQCPHQGRRVSQSPRAAPGKNSPAHSSTVACVVLRVVHSVQILVQVWAVNSGVHGSAKAILQFMATNGPYELVLFLSNQYQGPPSAVPATLANDRVLSAHKSTFDVWRSFVCRVPGRKSCSFSLKSMAQPLLHSSGFKVWVVPHISSPGMQDAPDGGCPLPRFGMPLGSGP